MHGGAGLFCVLFGFLVLLPLGETSYYSWSKSEAVPRCDTKLIAAVKQYWCKYGKPGQMNETSANNSYLVAATTAHSETVDCVYFTLTPPKWGQSLIGNWHILLANGTTVNKTYTIIEKCGKLKIKGTKTVVYIISSEKEVRLLYTCSLSPTAPVGPPIMEVTVKKNEYDWTALEKTVDVMRTHFGLPVFETLETYRENGIDDYSCNQDNDSSGEDARSSSSQSESSESSDSSSESSSGSSSTSSSED